MRNRQMIVHWLMANSTASRCAARRQDLLRHGRRARVPGRRRPAARRSAADQVRRGLRGGAGRCSRPTACTSIRRCATRSSRASSICNMPSYTGFVQPRLEPVRATAGTITDVTISYPLDLTTQMLEYSGRRRGHERSSAQRSRRRSSSSASRRPAANTQRRRPAAQAQARSPRSRPPPRKGNPRCRRFAPPSSRRSAHADHRRHSRETDRRSPAAAGARASERTSRPRRGRSARSDGSNAGSLIPESDAIRSTPTTRRHSRSAQAFRGDPLPATPAGEQVRRRAGASDQRRPGSGESRTTGRARRARLPWRSGACRTCAPSRCRPPNGICSR